MLTNEDSSWLAHAALNEIQHHYDCLNEPFTQYRPRMFPDGNQWCALYGENLQEGVAGFGDTPADAVTDFNKNWLNQRLGKENGK